MEKPSSSIFKELPDFGKLMTIDEFADAVECNAFIDYDGHGYWATATHQWYGPVGFIKPSTFRKEFAPEGATHVVWFNK